MRIHSLELNAYGPFAGHISIDFDTLNDEGIFLLNGPTGAGKSSILDAVCYALYGTTSSGRTDLKSRFADPATEPWVKLECTVGGGRYRIFRSPEYYRPKKRGEGLIKEQSKVTIEAYDAAAGDWETDPAVTRHKDAGDFMLSVIGLNAQQFNQVMLLPQGKFQQFLVASSGERESLLKKLFATADFEQVQEKLVELAKAAEAKAGQAEAQLDQLTDRACHALASAGAEDARALLIAADDTADSDGAGDEAGEYFTPAAGSAETADTAESAGPVEPAEENDPVEDLPATLAELADLRDRCQQLAQTQGAELDELRARLNELTELRRTWQTHLTLTAQQQDLTSRTARVDDLRKKLEAHARATAVLPLADQAARAHRASEDATARTAQLTATLQTGSTQTSTAEGAPECAALHQLTAYLTAPGTEESPAPALTAAADTLAEVANRVNQLQSLTATQEQEESQTPALTAAVETARQKLDAQRTQREQLATEHASLEDAPAQLARAEAAEEAARTSLTAARALTSARAEVGRAEQQAAAAADKRRAAAARAEELQQQRFDQAATILAVTLTPGTPCQVCGSTEHPAPATTVDNLPPVTAEQVRSAQDARNRAEAAAQTALGALATATARVTSLEEDGAPEQDAANAALADAQQAVTTARQTLARRTELAQLITRADSGLTTLAEAVDRARSALTEHTARLTSQQADISDLRTQLAGYLTDHPADDRTRLNNRVSALRSLATGVGQLDAAHRDATTRADEAQAAADALTHALATHRFTTLDEARTAHLTGADAKTYSQQVSQHDQALAAVTAQLATDAHTIIARRIEQGEQAPDQEQLADLAATVRTLSTQRDTVIAAHTRLAGAHSTLTTIHSDRTRLLTVTQTLIDDAHLKRELAATATAAPGADNRLKMTLTTYVLASQLTEVALAASEHLEAMTHGRYRLEHTDAAEGRGSKSGLGLVVHDAWHGAARDPKTLSGGETFMASLSLALGLADVVQSTNGGIEIDTLFVDEGFGSLDDDTLEEVMATIDTLRERGRVIGLISHVTEMKNRIPTHIQLTSSPQGSTLRTETRPV